MKKLIVILIALSLSSCAALREQQEHNKRKMNFLQNKKNMSLQDLCDRHLKNKKDFENCNDKSYELQRVLANYDNMYGERFNFKLCKQFVVKKTVKKGKKKVNKKK